VLQPGFRPEAKVLLWTSRICDEEVRLARIQALLNENFDWDYLLQIALHNRLHPLLYWKLKQLSCNYIPSKVMDKLRQLFHQNALLNMFFSRELIEILDLFEAHGIASLPYKGPLLTSSLYGNLGLRQFWDLDILVHKEDVLKAKDLLLSCGYRPERELSRKEELVFLETDCEYNFEKEDEDAHIEIHWHILPKAFSSGFDSSYLWERAITVNFMNRPVLTLPPEETFLILCLHGGDKHQWSRLKWICDIARFMEIEKDMDWVRIFEDASKLGMEQTVIFAIYLASSLLHAQIPEAYKDKHKNDPQSNALVGLIQGRLFRENFGLPGFSEWLSYVKDLDDSSIRSESVYQKFKDVSLYIKTVMKPDFRDRYTLSLPSRLSFLSYFYRVWRLFRVHKGELIHRLR